MGWQPSATLQPPCHYGATGCIDWLPARHAEHAHLEHCQLQNFVAFLLSARETLVDIPVEEGGIHLQQLQLRHSTFSNSSSNSSTRHGPINDDGYTSTARESLHLLANMCTRFNSDWCAQYVQAWTCQLVMGVLQAAMWQQFSKPTTCTAGRELGYRHR